MSANSTGTAVASDGPVWLLIVSDSSIASVLAGDAAPSLIATDE